MDDTSLVREGRLAREFAEAARLFAEKYGRDPLAVLYTWKGTVSPSVIAAALYLSGCRDATLRKLATDHVEGSESAANYLMTHAAAVAAHAAPLE